MEQPELSDTCARQVNGSVTCEKLVSTAESRRVSCTDEISSWARSKYHFESVSLFLAECEMSGGTLQMF